MTLFREKRKDFAVEAVHSFILLAGGVAGLCESKGK